MNASVIYSIVVITPITPSEPLPPLSEIFCGSLVIVEGHAPNRRYGMALNKLNSLLSAVLAFYGPSLSAGGYNLVLEKRKAIDIELQMTDDTAKK